MHESVKVALIAGFFALLGAAVPLMWPHFFPPTPYTVLDPTPLEIGQSVTFDNGLFKLQARKIEGQPHRFYALIEGGTGSVPFRRDFEELMQAQRVTFRYEDKEYALHVVKLKSGTAGAAESVVVEVARLE